MTRGLVRGRCACVLRSRRQPTASYAVAMSLSDVEGDYALQGLGKPAETVWRPSAAQPGCASVERTVEGEEPAHKGE